MTLRVECGHDLIKRYIKVSSANHPLESLAYTLQDALGDPQKVYNSIVGLMKGQLQSHAIDVARQPTTVMH